MVVIHFFDVLNIVNPMRQFFGVYFDGLQKVRYFITLPAKLDKLGNVESELIREEGVQLIRYVLGNFVNIDVTRNGIG